MRVAGDNWRDGHSFADREVARHRHLITPVFRRLTGAYGILNSRPPGLSACRTRQSGTRVPAGNGGEAVAAGTAMRLCRPAIRT